MKVSVSGLKLRKAGEELKTKPFNIQVPALVSKVRSPDVKKGLELINGLDWLKEGDSVLLKVNINSDDVFPGTTNPAVMKRLIKLLYAKGASKVVVGDRSSVFWEGTKHNARVVGITRAAEEAGAEMVYFEEHEWCKMPGFLITRKLGDYDKIVNLCVLKTHAIAGFTLSLKNMIGITHPRSRIAMHAYGLNRKVARVNKFVRPEVNIVDGTKCFIDGGPDKGVLREPKVLFASRDRVALDVTCVNFLKSLGSKKLRNLNPWEHDQIREAVKLGLGVNSETDIKVVENQGKI